MRVHQKAFYADLFSKTPTELRTGPLPAKFPDPSPLPAKNSPAKDFDDRNASAGSGHPAAQDSRALVPANDKGVEVSVETPPAQIEAPGRPSPLQEIIGDIDARNLSPREMTNLSQDLYTAGVISFDEYSMLAFQPELHSEYNRTIGALTGKPAAPDQRRDFVSLWRERADFQHRRKPERPDFVFRSEHYAPGLAGIQKTTNLIV
ncbi:MAG: hypothetical protein H8E39_12230 [Alphaproteobacteria bacterium]|nr:hypothetical protein [Alphaproteobacteria bacterium]